MALLEAGFADHLLFSAERVERLREDVTVFLPKLKAAGAPDDVAAQDSCTTTRAGSSHLVPKRSRKK